MTFCVIRLIKIKKIRQNRRYNTRIIMYINIDLNIISLTMRCVFKLKLNYKYAINYKKTHLFDVENHKRFVLQNYKSDI